MPFSEENPNAAVACNYADLATYNAMPNSGEAMSGLRVPITTAVGYTIVPAYGRISYDSLTHGKSQPSCSGFFTISSAYGAGANNCQTQYVKRLCA